MRTHLQGKHMNSRNHEIVSQGRIFISFQNQLWKFLVCLCDFGFPILSSVLRALTFFPKLKLEVG